jgi:signal transduction histidine kinase
MTTITTSPGIDADEVSALIETLAETERRLEEVTAGEIDTVTNGQGRVFLLRRAGEQLRHAEAARQAAILDMLPAHIAVLDPRGVIVSVNEAWRAFAAANGLPDPDHAIGLSYVDVCDRARGRDSAEANEVGNGIRAVLDGGLECFSMEYSCASPTTPRWFLLTAAPLAEDQGAVVMHADVTAGKRAEASLLEELERQVAARTTELETVNRELDAFSSSVSHDLRAPLRAIDGFSRIVLEEHAGELSPDARGHLESVRESTQKMGQLIDDLLTFSRLARQPVTRQRVSMNTLVEECLLDLRFAQDGRRMELTVGDLPDCDATRSLVKQVWLNLLSNAFKYTRKRPVARIEIGAREGSDTASPIYFVKDDGAGFDMRFAGKLFDVFQRLHSADDYEGTGVGLAIVRRVVERHGGRVWAESEPDRGATFLFTLSRGPPE